MRIHIAILAIGIGLIIAPARGEDLTDAEAAALRREAAELKALILRANERLQAIESRLNGSVTVRTLEAPSGKLRFPINIERAMMGDAARPWQRPLFLPLRPHDQPPLEFNRLRLERPKVEPLLPRK